MQEEISQIEKEYWSIKEKIYIIDAEIEDKMNTKSFLTKQLEKIEVEVLKEIEKRTKLKANK